MKHIPSIALFLLLSIDLLIAQGETKLKDAPISDEVSDARFVGVDYLTPVKPYPAEYRRVYDNKLRRLFKMEKVFELRMLVRPSFKPEYVVSLENEEEGIFQSPKDKMILRFSKGDKNIWYSINNGESKEGLVTVTTKSVEFPKILAKRVKTIWDRMLYRTRYGGGGGGLDGTVYEFSTWCIYGEVWSPRGRQSPTLFIELGDSLIAYVESDVKSRDVAEKEIEKSLLVLEKYLNKHYPDATK